MQLSTRQWQGNTWDKQLLKNPSWQQVQDVILALDGNDHTEVIIDREDTSHLAIGGGANQYIVCLARDYDQFVTLVDPTRPKELVDLVAGGQLGNYPGDIVVDSDLALRAARHYYDTGQPVPDLDWRR